ncbi:DUF6790 family protein [Pseudaminobacter soli (ex Li et al. 2025)]|uniref:Uncharacterized protein n=1 Tax=Pseudaminobacter soli (ex Li et al. 2025) TaxID=1295366 RepID=A0A2P7SCS3_9HYPH|nr:DUF6790 family protein [Mesorhizobium soli]PSJ60314.1 hypothetical protein C7I85_14265 [Mesorhizobium soli]
MYALVVLLLMLVMPAGSILTEYFHSEETASLLPLVGKWFVFWMVGIRLLLAGLRQFFQPSFTARRIFGIESGDVLPFVRELGVANFSTGVVGTLSLVAPSFVLPMAIVGALFYGIAGIRHATDTDRNVKQNVAMVSDLFACVVLAIFALLTLWRLS